jgi:hypothetical protein
VRGAIVAALQARVPLRGHDSSRQSILLVTAPRRKRIPEFCSCEFGVWADGVAAAVSLAPLFA